jgi:hypothetical protein
MRTKERPAVEHYDRIEKDCLRKKWSGMKESGFEVLFQDFQEFVDWCAETGWTYGLKLKRKNNKGPFLPENCLWEKANGDPYALQEMARKWEAGVGPIREKLRPYLDAIEKKKSEPKYMFQYEHPDLVREGIVFEGSSSV